MKILIAIAVFSFICSSMKITEEPNDDRVLIELYSESLCPDCMQFILGSFSKAVKTQDIFKISDIRVYPYGNARWAQNGSTYSFTCQHGAKECQGNIIEVCALRLYDPEKQGLPFIICLEGNTANWTVTYLSYLIQRTEMCNSTWYGLGQDRRLFEQ